MADPQRVDVVFFAAFREFVWLNILQSDDRLGHYASMPITTKAFFACKREKDECGKMYANVLHFGLTDSCLAPQVLLIDDKMQFNFLRISVLTSVVVSHSDIVTDHVCHRSGQQMRFVHINIDANADRLWCAHGLWHCHTRFAAYKYFAAVFRLQEQRNDHGDKAKTEKKKSLNTFPMGVGHRQPTYTQWQHSHWLKINEKNAKLK